VTIDLQGFTQLPLLLLKLVDPRDDAGSTALNAYRTVSA
jgi:hypothetical protein